jgi:hypothetical protein
MTMFQPSARPRRRGNPFFWTECPSLTLSGRVPIESVIEKVNRHSLVRLRQIRRKIADLLSTRLGHSATGYKASGSLTAKSISIKDAKRRSGDYARKVTELTPGDLLCVASATENAARHPDRADRATCEKWGIQMDHPADKSLLTYERIPETNNPTNVGIMDGPPRSTQQPSLIHAPHAAPYTMGFGLAACSTWSRLRVLSCRASCRR